MGMGKENTLKHIYFSWNELPKYAAYLLGRLISKGYNIEIVSTKSSLPIEGLEEIIGKNIHWVDPNLPLNWKSLGLRVPHIFFQAGWYKKPFISLGNEVKHSGGKVILLSDNQFHGNLRQLFGSLYYRLKYKHLFDAVWVPGASGKKLMKFYGVPKDKIFTHLYSSNENIFQNGRKINLRSKQIIFVGRLIKVKGFKELILAFNRFIKNNPEWKLIVVGEGPLSTFMPNNKNFKRYDFKNPEQVAKLMQESRFLVLPSHEDHWPLVVNESVLCGCGLILSNKIGNIAEFCGRKNGIIFNAKSTNSLFKALVKINSLKLSDLVIINEESHRLGSKFNVTEWIKKYQKIINSFD